MILLAKNKLVSKYFISIKFNNETDYKQTNKIYQSMQIKLSYIEMFQ